MGLTRAPTRPQWNLAIVDPKTGKATHGGQSVLDEMWKTVAAGQVVVPCTATGTNLIQLVPNLSSEGAKLYADFMPFSFVAAATSTGSVTAFVTDTKTDLATLKVFKSNGAAQAGVGDVVSGSFYVAYYVDALDSGNGGLVLK